MNTPHANRYSDRQTACKIHMQNAGPLNYLGETSTLHIYIVPKLCYMYSYCH